MVSQRINHTRYVFQSHISLLTLQAELKRAKEQLACKFAAKALRDSIRDSTRSIWVLSRFHAKTLFHPFPPLPGFDHKQLVLIYCTRT